MAPPTSPTSWSSTRPTADRPGRTAALVWPAPPPGYAEIGTSPTTVQRRSTRASFAVSLVWHDRRRLAIAKKDPPVSARDQIIATTVWTTPDCEEFGNEADAFEHAVPV